MLYRFNRVFAILTCLFFFSNTSTFAQHKIEFQIDNYEKDSVVVGYYVLDKQLVHDTLVSKEKGKFTLIDTLASGVYILLTMPDNEFLQFIVNENEPEFKMEFDFKNKTEVKFTGSKDNQVFQDYVDFLGIKRPRAELLRDTIAALTESESEVDPAFQAELDNIDKDVVEMQAKLISEHPDLISTLLLKANKEIVLPTFDNTEKGQMAQYLYYKDHYFDFIEMENPNTLRTPFLYKRVDYYIKKLTSNSPDSIVKSIDTVLKLMEPSEETYRYYLSNFLNEYIQTKIIGYDAVFVYLAEEYYAKGKAPWVEEENLLKILDRAKRMKPVLLGKTAPDIMVYGEDGSPISIDSIDYEYLVLLFWSPDCGHCKKTMHEFVEFNDKYKEKGIKTFAICTKLKDKTKDCWEMIKEKEMLGFYNGADEFHKSRFKVKFNVDTTPKVFILDKNREILMKNIAASQLERVFEEIAKIKEQERTK